jgi:hypothetical protein
MLRCVSDWSIHVLHMIGLSKMNETLSSMIWNDGVSLDVSESGRKIGKQNIEQLSKFI